MPLWKRTARWAAAAALLLLLVSPMVPQPAGDSLERGFQDPPASARPRVWWHWMNGNITQDGIRLDLEWMKRIGLGGFQNFDAALNTPQVVERRLVYMTPEWKQAFRYAVTLADQLGLEMAIAGSPGWSESGGPWVPPAQAMKKLVWSETLVEGGRPFTDTLPKPPSTTGPFQNIARAEAGGRGAAVPEFYADSAVIAFRVPQSDVPLTQLNPKVTSSGGQFDLAQLTDGDLVRSSPLPVAAPGAIAWIQFEFASPQTVRAITLAPLGSANRFAAIRGDEESGIALEAGDNPSGFRTVVPIPREGSIERTVAFPPVTARFFRVTFRNNRPANASGPNEYPISELVLQTAPRVNRFEEKDGYWALTDLSRFPTPPSSAADATPKSAVVDLTARLRPDGTLDWTPPAGRWRVLRFGYSLTGAHNSPASPEATGLEVDKLNRAHVKAYLDNYLGQYQDATGGLMGKRGLQYVITDSWEAGLQNWTDDMIDQFAKRRGYDPRPWLPVLAGHVVESAAASDGFLWDFRKTIGELTVESHYGQIGESLHARGMGRYSESHESGRAFIGDGMEVKRDADIPMSAMWTQMPGTFNEPYGYDADVRESASVAHLYGQNLVAAESLTARSGAWAWAPETLKPTADQEMAMGLNRFVIHTSVHQPLTDRRPGLSLGIYGQWFTRNETWAELAAPWITYLARSSYMLQQGRFTADILYFYGEDSNLTTLFADHTPDIPAGFNFDYVNADAIVNRLSVSGGRIVTPNGMSYRVLAIDPRVRQMSLPVLRKIGEMAKAGAVIVGPKPATSPSLADAAHAEEFRGIANRVWGTGDGREVTLADALAKLQVTPDFEYAKPSADTRLLFVHRVLPDGEVYWVNNRAGRSESVGATFRIAGRAPEIWHPDTGRIEPAAYKIEGSRTTVPLSLDAWDAVFVVFRKPAGQPARAVARTQETPLATLGGPWEIAFQPGLGAPAALRLDRLSSWSKSTDPGVKYFSGTGTYTVTLQADPAWFRNGTRLWLDLGDVKNLAQVSVNSRALGIAWKPPFRFDVTEALKPGANTISIAVTNLWANRLIGDKQPEASVKYTFTTQDFYRADSPLLSSGLLGPVRIVGRSN